MAKVDPGLRQFATNTEWQLLALSDRLGSDSKAAKQLGVGRARVTHARKRVRRKAALRGYFDAPEAFVMAGKPVPDGFVLRGQSALVGKDGKTQLRWDKTKQSGMDPEDAPQLPGGHVVSMAKLHDSEGRVVNYWTREELEKATRERQWRDFAVALAQENEAKWKPLRRDLRRDNINTMATYLIGDHHIGMLAWGEETLSANYDIPIAEQLLKGAIDHLAVCAGDAKEALVIFMGDLMHYDGLTAETPTGAHRLDPDSRYGKMVRATIRCVRHVIGRALDQHETVRVIVEIGNHDLSSMVFLAEMLANFYENEPRVIVDTSPAHFHYVEFGKCLIGSHHGHMRKKLPDLPLIMATDEPEAWGRTTYRYFWTGHIHHDKALGDANGGCRAEAVRVMAPTDAWASQAGYRSMREMKAVVYDARYGEVARYTVNPEMLGVDDS